MADPLLGFSRTLNKVGGSILICVCFLGLFFVLDGFGITVNTWMILLGLIPLALGLRFYVSRVDKSYDRETRRRQGREG